MQDSAPPSSDAARPQERTGHKPVLPLAPTPYTRDPAQPLYQTPSLNCNHTSSPNTQNLPLLPKLLSAAASTTFSNALAQKSPHIRRQMEPWGLQGDHKPSWERQHPRDQDPTPGHTTREVMAEEPRPLLPQQLLPSCSQDHTANQETPSSQALSHSACDIASTAKTQHWIRHSTVPRLHPLGARVGGEQQPRGRRTLLWDTLHTGVGTGMTQRLALPSAAPGCALAVLRAEGTPAQHRERFYFRATRVPNTLPVGAAAPPARGRVAAGALPHRPASSRPLQRLFPEKRQVKALLRLGGKKQNTTKADFRI